ncbi:MAG TPA: thiamine-phosphate kinase [Gemmatimonadales bacterium]|nr:thiamine-phosphate kinase [Gemmatimonadales bacterium]
MTNLDLGPGREFDRIRRILGTLGPLARGVGDDCALIPEAGGRGTLVVSVDLSVENVHFRRDWLTMEEVGWRAAAAALSDLAAEGAETIGVLASVGAPAESPEEDLLALMAGVGAAAYEAGGAVLGGDLTASPHWVVDVTVLGRAERPVTRAGARPGDGLWVTGALGGARAALVTWRQGGAPTPEARHAFVHPTPRIEAGRALARSGAHAMLDISDGLGGDAAHLAAASGVMVEVNLERVPVASAVPAVATTAGLPAAQFAALGGEDYELLVALPAAFGSEQAARFVREVGLPLTRIGEVRGGSGTRFQLGGRTVALPGYDHFA